MNCCGFFGEPQDRYAVTFDIKYPFGMSPDEYTNNRDRINTILDRMGYEYVYKLWLSPVSSEHNIIGSLRWQLGTRPDIREMLDELTIMRVAGPPVDILQQLQ